MTEKIYCGNGKSITTKYGDLMKLSLTQEDVQAITDNLDNGWVNMVVNQRKEPSKGGMTHYLTIDTWKPEQAKQQPQNEEIPQINPEEEVKVENIPF